jgi:hypothetical protein
MGTSTHAADSRDRSYRDVLRDRRVAGLLAGDVLANVGTGMLVVAMPLQTLRIRGGVPAAPAIGMVESARRSPPRSGSPPADR